MTTSPNPLPPAKIFPRTTKMQDYLPCFVCRFADDDSRSLLSRVLDPFLNYLVAM